MQNTIAIIGGGASGLCAAIRARELGADVTILERQPRVGKKLIATGNGRCNLTNLCAATNPEHYHGGTDIMREPMRRFPPEKILSFFRTLGVEALREGEKVYPLSEQASSVLDALRFRIDELGVRTRLEFDVTRIEQRDGRFVLHARDGRNQTADKLIMACGSPSAPSLGGTDAGLALMRSLGFDCAPSLPALVQLRTDTEHIRALTGIRFMGGATLLVDGTPMRTEPGEILFAEYGLSGPAILQLSRIAAAALKSRKSACVHLHILPNITVESLRRRRDILSVRPIEHFFTGMLNKRLGQTLLKIAGCGTFGLPSGSLCDFQLENLSAVMADWPIDVVGTQGLEHAQVASGGVKTAQFDPLTLASLRVPGLYATGELLDIDGDCGGFNLQWAWASGLLAAESACADNQ